MKQIIKLGVLGLCTLSLMGSCKKKGGEPLPPTPPKVTPGQGGNTGGNPSGNTGEDGGSSIPIDNTKGIKLVLSPNETSFSLSQLSGEGISIEGATKSSEDKTIKITASKAGTTVTLKGSITAISIIKGSFESIDFSQAPVTLSSVYVGNIGSKQSLDFSTLTNLKKITLYKAPHATLPKSLKILTLNESHSGISNEFTLTEFPNLEELYLIGLGGLNKNINFKGSTKLKKFCNSRSFTSIIDLSNCPNLTGVLLRDMNGQSKVELSESSLLKEGKAETLFKFSGFVTDTGNNGLKSLNLSGASLTNFNSEICKFTAIIALNLKNNKLATADFSAFKQLMELDLTGNITLKGSSLTQALQSLPQRTGAKLRIGSLSTSDQAIVTSKGWIIADN